MTTARRGLSAAVLASLLVHGGAAWLIPQLARPNASTFEVPFDAVTSPRADDPIPAEASEVAPVAPIPSGAESLSSLDTDHADGCGGSGVSPDETMRLFPFLSTVQLQDTELNQFESNQAQRIRTANARWTLEQRRATPHPEDAVFLASGSLGHAERRPVAQHDAVVGAPHMTRSNKTAVDARTVGTDSPSRRKTSNRHQDPLLEGILFGTGRNETRAAKLAWGRPNVDRGSAATTAAHEDPRIRDDVDAELLAARLERSWVDASLQRSATKGPGVGGSADLGPGVSPVGEDGRGATANPWLPGTGQEGVLDTRDARYVRWFARQRARVRERLVFPEARALAKDQGVSVMRIAIDRGGKALAAPVLLRSSGYAEFDAAAAAALAHALPLEALPDGLARGIEELWLVLPITFDNPMVQ